MRVGIVFAIYVENDDHLYFLEKTLKSVQISHKNQLVVVENFVDNSVADKYLELVGKYHAKRIINDENNVSKAWNKGLNYCLSQDCTYVLIANTDIVLKRNCIDNLVEFAEKHPEHLMVTASVWDSERTLETDNEDDGVAESPHFSCFMVRNTFMQETGGFDENFKPAYREDNDMHWRMALLGLTAVSIGKARFYHYGSRTIHASNDPVISEMKLGSANTAQYYVSKWGGNVGEEKYLHPFNRKETSPKDW